MKHQNLKANADFPHFVTAVISYDKELRVRALCLLFVCSLGIVDWFIGLDRPFLTTFKALVTFFIAIVAPAFERPRCFLFCCLQCRVTVAPYSHHCLVVLFALR